jgi:hypothetical protein
MNKLEEIKYKIKVHEGAVALSTDILISLRAELTEAEKPKLRHGDFGFCWDNTFVVVEQDTLQGTPKAFFADQSGQLEADENMPEAVIFGNIFDLMKDWGKDLGKYEKKCRGGNTLIISRSHIAPSAAIEFRINKNGCYATADIPQAEEIWRKLGQMIMTLKRKQS